MLHLHKSGLLWRRRKRGHSGENIFYHKIYSILIIIGCVSLFPQGLTQINDDVYIVKPTPALRLGKEELTTVLLVNNDNHGRYTNVRPEVRLLTSTARTFIQEGVTTEYATQVVGTTLDNGRVYAKYLKKSSRVLYDNDTPVPSVVTSWVGEPLNSGADFLPQSHNDLFDADQPDWQAIDDRLLGDGRNQDDFVPYTDYVGSRRKTLLPLKLKEGFTSTSNDDYSSSSKSAYNLIAQLVLEDNPHKVTANKVLAIEDLPTYTIKQNYEPNAYLISTDESEFGDGSEVLGRNPRLIYKKLLQSSLSNGNGNKSDFLVHPKPVVFASRQFATVTYYGFSDFTTVVGDSIIVFSPSTTTNLNYNAHVTSIKGEATLAAGMPQAPSESKVPITIAQDIIEPTIAQRPTIQTLLETIRTTTRVYENSNNTAGLQNTSSVIENKITELENTISILQPSEAVQQLSQTTILSTQSKTTVPSVLLSRPSDEEIFRIYNELANANIIAKTEQSSTKFESATTKTNATATLTSSTTTKYEANIETSNVEIFGGATTIFFEDDLFANFEVPSKTKGINLNNSTKSLLNSSTESSLIAEHTQQTELATRAKTIEIAATPTEESKKIIETNDDCQLLTTPNTDIADTDAGGNLTNAIAEKVTTKYDLLDTNSSSALLSNVLVKEINPNDEEKLPIDCISTSQVFLTQLPKTITLYETMITADSTASAQLKPEITQKLQHTFEIKEATKHYCIQASKPQLDLITSISSNEKENVTTSRNEGRGTEDVTEKFINKEADNTEKIFNLNAAEESVSEFETQTIDLVEQNEPTTGKNENGTYEEEHVEEEEAFDQPVEDNEGDEEIELIYKTLYTTYTYLTTFFNEDSTSISSHTEVVTNVITSTLGMDSNKIFSFTNLTSNLADNEINPTGTLVSLQMESTKRFTVPSEVESYIRTDQDDVHQDDDNESAILVNNSIKPTKSSDTLPTFYTTYTYYTTIFADSETEIMSHTEVITNIKKFTSTTATASKSQNMTPLVPTVIDNEYFASKIDTLDSYNENAKNTSATHEINSSAIKQISSTELYKLPHIPDLGDLSAITLITDVRSSSSPGNKKIINNFEVKTLNDKASQQQLQQPSIYEDQISSESNTDADEIVPSTTLLLQTSFTTFTYYTTMYSGDKTNVISHLETLTNTVTETLKPFRTINLEGASVPITYFTTFTYWTKLVKDDEITTLSREETVSNVIVPTLVQQDLIMQLKFENVASEMEKVIEKPPAPNDSLNDEMSLQVPKEAIETIKPFPNIEMSTFATAGKYKTNVLDPTTYYTTYTYYTTSYETDKAITHSRFETITNIITPIVTLKNSDVSVSDSLTSESTIVSTSLLSSNTVDNIDQKLSSLVFYDFKKIFDADGVSTIFFTTEIKPTINSDGQLTEIISSSSSILINAEKRNIQTTTVKQSIHNTSTLGPDGQIQKQYKTGLVRLIEGTRIANRTTTLYQSKVIGTVIDQRYAQIIESTSSFIFDKTKTPTDANNKETLILPTTASSTSHMENIQATEQVEISIKSSSYVEGSILESRMEHDIETTTKLEVDPDEENNSKIDEKLRFPFQTKKSPFISPLKPFYNRNRLHFAPKKNSNATIITRSDFTPTITATPALKTINRFPSARRGNGGFASSSINSVFITSSRRFSRPSKTSIVGVGNQLSSTLGISRNWLAPTSNTRGSFISSSRRLGGSTTIKPSLSRPALFSSGFSGNSRLRVKQTATAEIDEMTYTIDTTTVPFNSQEEWLPQAQDESDNEEYITTESSRRQNNPLLRLRKPLNRPQGFTPARVQSNSANNAVSLRRNPLTGRSRKGNTVISTTTKKPKPRTFQSPLTSQNRIRTTNPLFPQRNIFGAQKSEVTTEENRDLSEEDLNENNEDSEYEDEEEEESESDDEEENSRRRRSNNKTEQRTRRKREADSAQQNRSNFRNRFRRPKLASAIQSEDERSETKEAVAPTTYLMTSTQRTRSRFGARYSSSPSATVDTTTAITSSNHKPIRPTRPTSNNNGRAQFTLREKDSAVMSTTQKGLNSVKRPAFRRLKPGGNVSSRRLSSSTAPSSSTSEKRRLKSFTNNDSTTTSRNSVTSRSRTTSTTPGRSRSTGHVRDSNIGNRNRGRNNHNYNEGYLALDNSGTIIVTHVTPAEVTIPVVNGKVTEYKQVVTAKTSTEVLGPLQYKTTIAANGLPQLALTREDYSVNYNGATEVTKYVLHETPTTTITFTPTTIRGRKTSFSHVLPSTVYSVEQVVSTLQPQLSANAPLANILLSQLLLGNVGLPAANPLLGALGGAPGVGLGTAVASAQPATPITEYKTHASTYVTTIFEGQSTVLPVTFQGKKILTTIFDTTAQTITATEFITDTIITTPTVMPQPQSVVNSLLLQQLLLQQHLQQQQQQPQQLQQSTPDTSYHLNGILNSVPPELLLGSNNLQELESSNNIRGSGYGNLLNEDDDFAGSSVDLDDIALQAQTHTHKNGKKKSRKNGKNHKRKNNDSIETQHREESSVITLYVSGRRPGEFSTVLSTVPIQPDSTQYKRHVHNIDSETDYLKAESEVFNEYLAMPLEISLLETKHGNDNDNKVTYHNDTGFNTQSLESIVGDVSLWYTTKSTTTKTNSIKASKFSSDIKNQIASYQKSSSTNFDDENIHLNSNNEYFFA